MADLAPFPIDPALMAIAIAYRNQAYIADEVLPRVPVGKQEFKYLSYPIAETFALPDTKVGRKSQPNEIDLTATELTDSTADYGLDDPVPQADISNAPANYSPLDRAAMQLTDYIMLDREKRAADLCFTAANYAVGQKVQLAGNDQWSSTHADSDPIDDIMTGLDACLIRPNIMTIGHAAWSKLARHTKIVKAVHGNDGDTGIARRRQVADLFELEDIYVGQSFLNTAKKGQAATIARVWGKHCALHYRNKVASTQGGVTFALTAQWGSRIAGKEADSKIGLRGGIRVRVGESVKEKIVAAQAGYFIEDCVA